MIPCPMPSCKTLSVDRDMCVRHLSWDHHSSDVAYLVIELLEVNKKAQAELEKLTIPKAEENKSEGAIP